MGRRGEDGLVQHVFPIAGELVAGDHLGRDGAARHAAAGHDQLVAHHHFARVAQGQGRDTQRPQGLDQAKAGGGVEA